MADPAPPPGFAVDDAPPPGFTLDDPATDNAPPANLPGFSDEQKQQILAYIPKAKDAADLEQFSSELTQGRSKIGNAQKVLADFAKGHREFSWTPPTPAQDKIDVHPASTAEALRSAIGDGILNGLDTVMPGLGALLRSHKAEGKAFTEHAANAAAFDYGPEVSGAIDTLLHPGSSIGRNVAHERAILEGDSEGHGVSSIAGELTGMGATAMLGNEAGLANLGRLPRAVATTLEGAAYGSGAAGPGDRATGAVTGAALGAGTQAAIAGVAARSAAKTAAKVTNQEFADAAERQGVSYMAADVPKAWKSKFATALSSLTFGGIPLAEQGEKNIATAATAASRAANDVGKVADSTGAGQAAQRGARQFMDSTEKKMGDLYDAIPIDTNAPSSVTNTRGALTNLSQSFQSNPKLAAAFQNPQISRFLDALTPQTTKEATGVLDAAGNPITRDVTHGGGLSWGDLKEFRTRVGKIIGQPGLTSDGQQISELRALYAALSDDMQATAKGYGPQATSAFNRANNYARARANRIENVVSLILGKDDNRAPQSAFEALQRLANKKGGDPIALARALRSMPEDEAGSVRATILDSLGEASPGRQDNHGAVFSPSDWLTNWNKISPRAKNILFPGEHRKALDDLALLFSGMKSSTKFANNSKTGLYVAATHTAALSFAHPVLGALDAALQYSGGKLLASPAFARRVASTPMNIKGATAFWSRPWVKELQVKNPAIAGEIQAFQHAFLTHANDNGGIVSAASADPQQQNQQ